MSDDPLREASSVNQPQPVESVEEPKARTMMAKKIRTRAVSAATPVAPKVNKTQAVLEYLVSYPGAKNQEVVDALGQRGISVAKNYVSMVRTKHGSKHGIRKRGRTSATAIVPTTTNLKAALQEERAKLRKRMEAIETLLG